MSEEVAVTAARGTMSQARSGPVSLAFAHRTRPRDRFPYKWEQVDTDRFSVSARLPDDHEHFTSLHGHRDPLLIAEAMRQSVLAVLHAGYGVPLEYRFVLPSLVYTCASGGLEASNTPADVEVGVTCSAVKWQGDELKRATADLVVRHRGSVIATGAFPAKILNPRIYQRVRGSRATPRVSSPNTPGVEPGVAGRRRSIDVLLSEDPEENTWLLRVDTSHATLFQRPKDHVPGMFLVEAARQAAFAVSRPAPFLASAGRIAFHGYTEIGFPCRLRAHRTVTADAGHAGVRVTGHQEGRTVFEADFSGGTVPDRERGLTP